ncbi:DUF3560 domain-containing protein [Streptomyces sp. NPDC051320]|uniref:DUF3560 domain-containing protein n=1 Tax=Streptomyces sp. NPDC051320 TaxID=3154644 RepID=UPI0034429EFE
MPVIKIVHTRREGTLVEGSRKGDGVFEIVRPHGFRYFPSLRQLGIGRSQDRAAQTWKINPAADALRAAGFEVETVIDEDSRRTFAEAETDRIERAEERAERYGERAGRAQENSDALRAQAKQLRDSIPLGQPLLVDHYSYNRDRQFPGAHAPHPGEGHRRG